MKFNSKMEHEKFPTWTGGGSVEPYDLEYYFANAYWVVDFKCKSVTEIKPLDG